MRIARPLPLLLALVCHRADAFAAHSPPRSSTIWRQRDRIRSHASTMGDNGLGNSAGEGGNYRKDGIVVVVGSLNRDLVTYAPSLPNPGETILGTDFVSSMGGKGGNQAVAASCIGIVDVDCGDGGGSGGTGRGGVHMIGRVGNDVMGIDLVRGLKSRGIRLNEDEFVVVGTHTGVASINVDTISGQNTIVVAPGANLSLDADDVESSLTDILSRRSGEYDMECDGHRRRDVVLVQLEIMPESALRALIVASRSGAMTILNPAPSPRGWEFNNEWYSAIDILVPNETELAAIFGLANGRIDDVTGEGEEMMAKALLERGIRHAVIVTLGARGAMIVMRDESSVEDDMRTIMICEPTDLPCKSDPVVDAVGAGDAFCGALAAYLSRGIRMEHAASMACGVASMSVRKRGAQESYPRAEDLPDCLRVEEDAPTEDDGISSGGTVIRTTKKRITFVTGNKNKLVEVRLLLSTGSSDDDERSPLPFDIDNMRLDLPELQGPPRDIAREKCRLASQELQTAVITEDTSLCFRGLNDLPGPYIKWFLDGLGHDGLNKLLKGCGDYGAYAQTIVAYAPGPDMEVLLFEGRTEGRIVPPRGEKEFGWDPIFEPTEDEQGIGSSRTYAEMTLDEKNAISHRGRAFRKLREFLLSDS